MRFMSVISGVVFLLAAMPAAADWATVEQELCVERHVREAPGEMTIAELRERCAAEAPARPEGLPAPRPVGPEERGVLSRRIAGEQRLAGKEWIITPHRANFILPYAYNSAFDPDFYGDLGYSRADGLKDYEAVFQISMKMPLWYGLYRQQGDLFFAFTSRAWWQVYAGEISAPFRETNYEPEIFAWFDSSREILGFRNVSNVIGLAHQSNGRDEPLSRSWNRIYASFLFEKGDLVFQFKPWYRLPEDEDDDDNPNIERYLGYADYAFGWAPGKHRFTGVVRNNLKSWDENKGSIELNYSYPVWGGMRLYVQYFNGYGDGLIYYDQHSSRVGVGIALNDVL
jgi:phospholipase A1